MIRITRVVPAALLAIGLFGSGIQASALGAGFAATVQPDCVAPGQHLLITISNLQTSTVMSIRATYTDSAPGGGTQYVTGHTNAQGIFTTNITIPGTASAGTGSLTMLAASAVPNTGPPASVVFEAEVGTGSFLIQSGTDACPSPGVTTIFGSHLTNAVGYDVKKACDAGVSGNAVFAVSATLGELGRFVFPPVTLVCNGAAVTLPALPVFASTVTLHETTPATGAVAAADTVFTLPPESMPVTIHNAKAAATATPTPTPKRVVVLAGTGGGTPSDDAPWWPALGLGVLLASAVAWTVGAHRRRGAPTLPSPRRGGK